MPDHPCEVDGLPPHYVLTGDDGCEVWFCSLRCLRAWTGDQIIEGAAIKGA